MLMCVLGAEGPRDSGPWWDNVGIIVDCVWTILESCWDNVGTILGLFWDHVWTKLRSFWDKVGAIFALS